MKIALGSDHKGFAFKSLIKTRLMAQGHDVVDFGANSEESSDFADFAFLTAQAVSNNQADRGILVCWTGNGMAIAANKVHGIRAGLAFNSEMAELTRAHNDANVLVLSGKYTPQVQITEIVDKFLATEFEGGRHQRRIDKIRKYEDED
jgi:ribose 5-phosphate isomerase B